MAATEVRRRKNKPQPSNLTSAVASSLASGESKKEVLTANTSSNKTPTAKYDEYAWFIVFILALSYFILTRSGGGNRNGLLSKLSKPYEVVSSSVIIGDASSEDELQKNKELLKSIFYVQKSKSASDESNELVLAHKLEVVISSPPDVYSNATNTCPSQSCQSLKHDETPFLSHLSSTTWVHDAGLGRGYLLIADAGRSGRIWRWEVGGGPITIGRSLHMENSGCRSGLWVDGGKCPDNLFNVDTEKLGEQTSSSTDNRELMSVTQAPLLGTASIVVELTKDAERPTEGKNLIVAEWGERRIVRVEGETGARTPLVTLISDGSEMRRVYRPNHLMYTPFGDMLFSDSYENDDGELVAAVYRLREAVHVPPIPVERSREAHGWTHTTADGQADSYANVDTLFQTGGLIDGMALGSKHSALFVSVVVKNESGWTKTIYKMPLVDEDEDDDDVQHGNTETAVDREIFHSITSKDCQDSHIEIETPLSFSGSNIAIDEKGTIYVAACPSILLLLSSADGREIGRMRLDDSAQSSSISSVSFGEDGYTYLTTSESLMRIKSRVKGRSIPTNMVLPPSRKSIRRDKRDKQ